MDLLERSPHAEGTLEEQIDHQRSDDGAGGFPKDPEAGRSLGVFARGLGSHQISAM